jgi:hypothetical protein
MGFNFLGDPSNSPYHDVRFKADRSNIYFNRNDTNNKNNISIQILYQFIILIL